MIYIIDNQGFIVQTVDAFDEEQTALLYQEFMPQNIVVQSDFFIDDISTVIYSEGQFLPR